MRLHARNFAMQAGATESEVPQVVAAMLAQGRHDQAAADMALIQLRGDAES